MYTGPFLLSPVCRTSLDQWSSST